MILHSRRLAFKVEMTELETMLPGTRLQCSPFGSGGGKAALQTLMSGDVSNACSSHVDWWKACFADAFSASPREIV